MCTNSDIGLTCNDRAQSTYLLAQLGSIKLVQHTLVGVLWHNSQYLVPISGDVETLQFRPGDHVGIDKRAVVQTWLYAHNMTQ
jgi:hypothetical protein